MTLPRPSDTEDAEGWPAWITHVDVDKTMPGDEYAITIGIEARGMEGSHELVLDMKDSEGRLCFPDKRAELRLSVTVGWAK